MLDKFVNLSDEMNDLPELIGQEGIKALKGLISVISELFAYLTQVHNWLIEQGARSLKIKIAPEN